MARIIRGLKTADGVTHDACFITAALSIEHGNSVVAATVNSRQAIKRVFRFTAGVQAFHSQADAEAGAKPIATQSVRGVDMEYFQFAGRPLSSLFPDGTDFSKLTMAEVIDAAVWAAVAAKTGDKFAGAEVKALGACTFNPETADDFKPVVNWQ